MQGSPDNNNLPRHLAIIMDGNGRWAIKKGKERSFGHHNAIRALNESINTSVEMGIEYLTLYAFSTENWNRPKIEINTLMKIFRSVINKEIDKFHKSNIKLNVIGVLEKFPKDIQDGIRNAVLKTLKNTGMTLTVALSYSGHEEIKKVVVDIAKKVKKNIISLEEINDSIIKEHLYTHNLPNPDLLIRTSGEYRISNFLLWQIAYTELYFTDIMWPDFSKEHLIRAIEVYQKRDRRFGEINI